MAAYTTIDNPELYFQTKLWTGTGSSNALTLDGSENMQPDFVWIKLRAGAADYGHRLFDIVRGATKLLLLLPQRELKLTVYQLFHLMALLLLTLMK